MWPVRVIPSHVSAAETSCPSGLDRVYSTECTRPSVLDRVYLTEWDWTEWDLTERDRLLTDSDSTRWLKDRHWLRLGLNQMLRLGLSQPEPEPPKPSLRQTESEPTESEPTESQSQLKLRWKSIVLRQLSNHLRSQIRGSGQEWGRNTVNCPTPSVCPIH
jgi:hypothetical protein